MVRIGALGIGRAGLEYQFGALGIGRAGLEYQFENCILDVQRRELRCDGILRPVEPQVFNLLHFLIVNRERVVSRDEIFRAVWQGRIVSDSVLGTRINAVRQAIGDDGIRQRLIRTIRGSGFRFVGAVASAAARPSPARRSKRA